MKRRWFLILTTLMVATPAFSNPNSSARPRTSRNISTPNPKEANWWFGPRVVFWQEAIQGKRNGLKADFHSQFTGITMSVSRRGQIGNSRRWYHSLGLEGTFGAAQASSLDPAFPDYLKDQPWFMIGANPGVVYRGTAVTDLYLSVPVMVRMISWKLSDSAFSMDRKTSFSTGISALSATRISPTTTIIAGFTGLWQWAGTQWVLGVDYDF